LKALMFPSLLAKSSSVRSWIRSSAESQGVLERRHRFMAELKRDRLG